MGSGRIGSTLGEIWLKAGHEVMFSSLDLEHDKALAARLGGKARAGTSKEAAAFGEVLLVAVPYSALPQVGRGIMALANPFVVGGAIAASGGPEGRRLASRAMAAIGIRSKCSSITLVTGTLAPQLAPTNTMAAKAMRARRTAPSGTAARNPR